MSLRHSSFIRHSSFAGSSIAGNDCLGYVNDVVGREAELAQYDRPGGRSAKSVDADDRAGQAHVAFPTKWSTGFDADSR